MTVKKEKSAKYLVEVAYPKKKPFTNEETDDRVLQLTITTFKPLPQTFFDELVKLLDAQDV